MSRMTAPGGRRHDTDHIRQVGQELLARGIEQALRCETPLALLELRQQRADAGRLKRLDDELVLGLAGIGGDLAGGDHFHAHFGLKRMRAADMRQMTPARQAFSSFRSM